MLEAADGHVDKHAGGGGAKEGRRPCLTLLRNRLLRLLSLGINFTEFIMRSEKARIAFFVFLDVLMFIPTGNGGWPDIDQVLHQFLGRIF